MVSNTRCGGKVKDLAALGELGKRGQGAEVKAVGLHSLEWLRKQRAGVRGDKASTLVWAARR